MVRRKRDVAIIVLRCALFGCCAVMHQAAFGAGIATLSIPAGGYVLVAQADTPVDPQAIAQETKSADAPVMPQAELREIKSTARPSKSKQRRRKPKMAGVPAGSQAVALESKVPELQVAVKGTQAPELQPVAMEAQTPEAQVAAQEAKIPEAQVAAKEAKTPEAQVATQEAEEIDALDKPLAEKQETIKAKIAAKPGEEVQKLKVADVSKKKYGMAPIRWGVLLTETLGKNRIKQTFHGVKGSNVGTGGTSNVGFVNTQTVDVNAKTYILQPYIAQVGGKLGLVNSRGALNDIDGRVKGVSGSGNLSVFPQSRFPFGMSAGTANGRNDSGSYESNSKTDFLSLKQSYRPLGSHSTYSAGYNLNKNTSDFKYMSGADLVNAREISKISFWDGSYSTFGKEHRNTVQAKIDEKQINTRFNTASTSNHLRVTDIYMPDDSLLTLNSNANLDLFSENTGISSRYLLANTNYSWQPEAEEIPLFVDGVVHFFDQYRAQGSSGDRTQSVGASVNARYFYSKNLTGYASGDLSSESSGGTRRFNTRQNGSVLYVSDVTRVGESSSYAWNGSTGATNVTGASPNSSVFGTAGHGLMVPYPFGIFGKEMLASSRIGQTLSTDISRIQGHATTLDNVGSVSVGSGLSGSKGELLGGYGRLQGGVSTGLTYSIIDRRVYGRLPSHSRISSLSFALRETSQTAYTRPGFSAEVALEASQGTGGGGLRLVGRSSASYFKSNVFGVRGLNYSGSAAIDKRSDTNVAEDLNANNPRFPWMIEQRLRYRIGQNELQFKADISDKYGIKTSSLWMVFKAWRTIGGAN